VEVCLGGAGRETSGHCEKPIDQRTPMTHPTDTILTPSKITAWLGCAHLLTLRHEVDSGER
jgi:hypothetical protein